MAYQLGILDQSPVFPGLSNYDALQKTISLAQMAEEWGYSRFWVSEHHHSNTIAGSSPEVLVSYLLAKTKRIRVGSGGVMLQHYSPYKVAENFHVLSTLAPGRVDLGIGKAPGGLPLSTKALQYEKENKGEDIEVRLQFLQHLIQNNMPSNHEFFGIEATPVPPVKPEVYLLGASQSSAKLAANLEISFAFARFINNDDLVLKEAAHLFKNRHPKGNFIASVAIIAAPTEREAKELASNQKIVKVHLASGRTLTLQTIEQAEKFGKESGETFEIEEQDANIIHGTPLTLKQQLDQFHMAYQIDEFMLHTPILDVEKRIQSFKLLGELTNTKCIMQS